MNRIDRIKQTLVDTLKPSTLEVIDDSQQHIGHPGAASGAGHFTVKIAVDCFAGQSLIACHRLVYQALAQLMQTEIHALRIEVIR